MSRQKLALILLIAVAILTLIASGVAAQQPGLRATAFPTGMGDMRPRLQATPSYTPPFGVNDYRQSGPTRTLPPPTAVNLPQGTAVFPNSGNLQATAQALTDWSALLNAFPGGLPDLASLDLSQIPFEYSMDDLEALLTDLLKSSPEAYAALVGFAAENLGTAVMPIYAGDAAATLALMASRVPSAAAWAAMQQVLGQFPEEIQAMIAQASNISGSAYWGVLSNGAAVLYTDACKDNPNCAIDLDALQVQVTNSSLGAYAVYMPSGAQSSAEALNLIKATFPALAGLDFIPIPEISDYYAFMAETHSTGAQGAASGRLVYAGVVSYVGQSLVYAVVVTGEGYLSMVSPF